jgi:16S rRNA (guanine966-N2)-methyltransferase
MRVVGGRFRGRALAGPRSKAIRPTSDRLRESLFNILQHSYGLPLPETRVLDLFAGTGALGLEAISRGAAHALFIETSVEGRGIIRANIDALQLTGVTRVLRRDATTLGRAGTITPFDLIFCDPPYGKKLGEQALMSAVAGGWLSPGALCVLEERSGTAVSLPPGLEALEQRETGDSQVIFASLSTAEDSRRGGALD